MWDLVVCRTNGGALDQGRPWLTGDVLHNPVQLDITQSAEILHKEANSSWQNAKSLIAKSSWPAHRSCNQCSYKGHEERQTVDTGQNIRYFFYERASQHQNKESPLSSTRHGCCGPQVPDLPRFHQTSISKNFNWAPRISSSRLSQRRCCSMLRSSRWL